MKQKKETTKKLHNSIKQILKPDKNTKEQVLN